MILQGGLRLHHLPALVAGKLSSFLFVNQLDVLLENIFVLHHLAAYLAGDGVLPDTFAVHTGQVGLEIFFGGAKLSTLIAGLGEGSMIVESVFL